MSHVCFDAGIGEPERRRSIYAGQLFQLNPGPASTRLIAFAAAMIEEAFAPHPPQTAHRALPFHPRYWKQPLKNGSPAYNYRRWNAESRFSAAQQIKSDTRPQPKAEEPVETEPYVCLLPPPGGLILFSGAQLHSTIPNTTE